jgi:uncharacterized SAM-binding protein YcdF (DUF218 family)
MIISSPPVLGGDKGGAIQEKYPTMLSLITPIVSNLFLWLWHLAALFLWWATKGEQHTRRWGVIFLVALWLLGTRAVAEGILWPLESAYRPPDIASLQGQGVRQVVVLTGGGFPVKGEMLSSAFPHASVYRFLGGMELCAQLGRECQIIFSGSAGRNNRDRTTALTMQELTFLLDSQRPVLAEANSGSTAEHPTNVRLLLEDEPFVLVTSASHMPRTMRVFQRAGLNPISYPVDFFSQGAPYRWADGLPSVENLWKINVALREYLALAFYTIIEEHEAQLLNYLKATKYEVGLLLNFGPKPEIKRKAYDNSRKPLLQGR